MSNKFVLGSLISVALSLSSAAFASNFVAAEKSEQLTDQGEKAITIVQEAEPARQTEAFISAENQLTDFVLEKLGREGWDPAKRRIVSVHAEQWNTDDPAFDPDFADKRALFISMASMGARAKIAEFMRTEMSAKDLLESPPSDVYGQLREEYDRAQMLFEKQKRQVVKLLARYNEQEAKVVNGADWSDRGKALMDAMIKKLDEEYDVSQLDAENKQRFEKTKSEYAEAVAKLEDIESKASKLKGEVSNTMTSTVESLAYGAVVGSTVLATTESWDKESGEYQVASLVVWSPKLKTSAQALMSGQIETLKPKQDRTINNWLKKQDLGTLAGPRQLIDENGSRWFVGAYAESYQGSSASKRAAKGRAEIYAKKEAAMSIFANIETRKQAMTAIETRHVDLDSSKTDIAKSFSENTSQALNNINLSGGSTILRKEIKHPITQANMYVVIYAVSAQTAKDAIALEKENYAAAMKIEKYQSFRRGEKQALDIDLASATGNTTDIEKGRNSQSVPVKKSTLNSPKETPIKQNKTNSNTTINAADFDEDDF